MDLYEASSDQNVLRYEEVDGAALPSYSAGRVYTGQRTLVSDPPPPSLPDWLVLFAPEAPLARGWAALFRVGP